MPKHLADLGQRPASAEHVGGGRMAESVSTDPGYPGAIAGVVNRLYATQHSVDAVEYLVGRARAPDPGLAILLA
jgi:hypothetical protein